MSMVFQSYAIWPHMTVFDNVAYGLRVRNESGAALKEKVRHALELVKMGPYAERNASALSGGQQQRVALARAIAFSPSVLLFDEPLSNLDAKLRSEMRIELRELQRRLGVTSLYVTHDLEEALAMSDQHRRHARRPGRAERHARRDLRLSAHGVRRRLHRLGQSRQRRCRQQRRSHGTVVVRTAGGNVVHGVTHGRPVGARGTLSIRTVHFRLGRGVPAGAINVWPARIIRSVFLGDLTQVHLDWGGQEIVVRQIGPPVAAAGEVAYLHAAPSQCALLEIQPLAARPRSEENEEWEPGLRLSARVQSAAMPAPIWHKPART